jgi:hypothetical protein
MSADNGIYILKTLSTTLKDREGGSRYTDPHPVYRVVEACAMDNFYFYQREQPYNVGAYLNDVWGDSPIFLSESEAWAYAENLSEDYFFLEYGISLIETDYIFYGS